MCVAQEVTWLLELESGSYSASELLYDFGQSVFFSGPVHYPTSTRRE